MDAARGLPTGAKLTLLKHSERGRGHFHDDDGNEHGYQRKHLAAARSVPERTIQRHYRVAEQAGYLVLHSGGHRTRQAAWHYTLPDDPWPCPNCETPGKGDTETSGKGDTQGDRETSGKGDTLKPERETKRESPTAPFSTPGKGVSGDSPISTVTDNPTASPACASLPADRSGNDRASQAPNSLSSLPSESWGTVTDAPLPPSETQPHLEPPPTGRSDAHNNLTECPACAGARGEPAVPGCQTPDVHAVGDRAGVLS